MGEMDALIEELDRVGGNDRQVQRFGEAQQPRLGARLDGVTTARNLDIEPPGNSRTRALA
jgi:hypothetical protein